MSTGEQSARQGSPEARHRCKHCGGIAARLSILDSREGKNFRLVRCLHCNKADWTEEG